LNNISYSLNLNRKRNDISVFLRFYSQKAIQSQRIETSAQSMDALFTNEYTYLGVAYNSNFLEYSFGLVSNTINSKSTGVFDSDQEKNMPIWQSGWASWFGSIGNPGHWIVGGGIMGILQPALSTSVDGDSVLAYSADLDTDIANGLINNNCETMDADGGAVTCGTLFSPIFFAEFQRIGYGMYFDNGIVGDIVVDASTNRWIISPKYAYNSESKSHLAGIRFGRNFVDYIIKQVVMDGGLIGGVGHNQSIRGHVSTKIGSTLFRSAVSNLKNPYDFYISAETYIEAYNDIGTGLKFGAGSNVAFLNIVNTLMIDIGFGYNPRSPALRNSGIMGPVIQAGFGVDI